MLPFGKINKGHIPICDWRQRIELQDEEFCRELLASIFYEFETPNFCIGINTSRRGNR